MNGALKGILLPGPDERRRVKKGRQISSGGVLYRMREGQPEVALIVLRQGKVHALPKGQVEPGEEPSMTALREVEEETGMRGEIVAPLDYVKYFYYAREEDTRYFKIVHFYLMRYLSGSEEAHDWEVEDVVWLPLPEALRRATYKTEREVLQRAAALLAEGEAAGLTPS
jgi:8-oxo-dGTP diphosphatase